MISKVIKPPINFNLLDEKIFISSNNLSSMSLSNFDTIDLIVKTKEGMPLLVIIDDEEILDPEMRFDMFTRKLSSYLVFLNSVQFKKDYANIKIKELSIEICYNHEPTDKMKNLKKIASKDKKHFIPIFFKPLK